MTQLPHPYFSFFPALPLTKTLRLGEWCVGTPTDSVPWRSQRFQYLARAHLNAFAKEGFEDGALMWHNDRGFDGTMPDQNDWAAIRATICFVALDANDHVRDDLNAAHYITTSENAELHTQPIDEEKAYITHQQGGLLKRMLSGGWKIGEEMVSMPDAVVAVSQPVIPSQHLATALFEALLNTGLQANRRIAVALEWHRFALSNPAAISWQQRLISLKTGFEALSGKSKTHLCGQFLRRLFEETTGPHVDLLPWAGILWSPRERIDLARTWMQGSTPQPVVRSELEDWFQALGDSRNEIIHEGKFTKGVYDAPPERPLSRYAGPLFWTADRLLRETVKALLGVEVLLCGRLKDADFGEKFLAAWRESIERDAAGHAETQGASAGNSPPSDADDDNEAEAEAADVATASPEPDDAFDDPSEANEDPPVVTDAADRDLRTLLTALNCDAANKIRLEKVTPQPSAKEGAEKTTRAARDRWGAFFGKKSVLINRAERDRLQAAGAEFPLRRYWTRCD